jgi:hypothetical protein
MTKKIGLILFSLIWVLSLMAGPLDDKTPGYFVDRYGQTKSSKPVSTYSFVHPVRGAVTIKGQFSAREFREGKLWVQPVFFLPSLKLASVRLQMTSGGWTDEQVEAALRAYGGEWKLVKKGVVTAWIAPDGSMAVRMLTWIDIHSKAIFDQVEKVVADEDAKRKAVPNF